MTYRVWGDGIARLLEGGALELRYRVRNELGLSGGVSIEVPSLEEAIRRGFTFAEPLREVGQTTSIHIEETRPLPEGWERSPAFRAGVERLRAQRQGEAS